MPRSRTRTIIRRQASGSGKFYRQWAEHMGSSSLSSGTTQALLYVEQAGVMGTEGGLLLDEASITKCVHMAPLSLRDKRVQPDQKDVLS